MPKRPKVPAALHSELTEYSSLLRALRTSNTLDLVQHLAEPPPTASHATPALDGVSLLDDEPVDEPPLTESASRDVPSEITSSTGSRLSNQARKKYASGKGKQRDTWTRWPLLAGDVHVPEWGLHDEVRHVARQALASFDSQIAPPHPADQAEALHMEAQPPVTGPSMIVSDEDEDEHPALTSVALRALTADSAAFLSQVLALLAAHVPNTEKSMQNRLRPINWETVIDIACTYGVITAEAAEHVRARMARLYPPTQPSVSHRAGHLSAMKRNLAETLAQCDDGLLVLPGYEYTARSRPKRKRSYKRREGKTEAAPSPKRQRSEDDG
ncbi:hypothetical protein BV20DRAFT_76381 [Pilatotrama ljubarskyi]|nr:hypothetical protein BV20DRAFT_76381 [Pilatotrama ljubarskyi]